MTSDAAMHQMFVLHVWLVGITVVGVIVGSIGSAIIWLVAKKVAKVHDLMNGKDHS